MVVRKVLELFGNYKTFKDILNNMPRMGLQTHQNGKRAKKWIATIHECIQVYSKNKPRIKGFPSMEPYQELAFLAKQKLKWHNCQGDNIS
jgi:hypothetical protein